MMGMIAVNHNQVDVLNIGIYGATQAGKTRFLFQLLHRWYQSNRLFNVPLAAHRFMETVEDEIKTYNRSSPTMARSEEMQVDVSLEDEGTPLRIVFRDLRGELLSGEMDNLNTLAKEGDIPRQVGKCNAFLFFFDPSSSENKGNVAEHHRRELRRADLFIKYVLAVRQNHHLPIMFVLTHLDVWENDKDLRARATAWLQECNQLLGKYYRSDLLTHFPPSLVDLKKTGLLISNVRPGHQEQVIQRLKALAEDSKRFAHADKAKVRFALTLGSLVVASLLIAALVVLFLNRSPFTNIDKASADVESLISSLSGQPEKETVQDAAKVNYCLVTLGNYLMELGSLPGPDDQLLKSFRKACSFVRSRADGCEASQVQKDLAVFSAYLKNTEDLEKIGPELSAARDRIWALQKERVLGLVKRALLDNGKGGLESPAQNLKRLATLLRSIVVEVNACDIHCSGLEKTKLLLHVTESITFCDALLRTGSYGLKIRVSSATLVPNKYGAAPLDRKFDLRLTKESSIEFLLTFPFKEVRKQEVDLKPPPSEKDVQLPLGGPMGFEMWVRGEEVSWTCDTPLVQFPAAGESLSQSLGLFLVSPRQPEVVLPLEWNVPNSGLGYRLRIACFGLDPRLPDLFIDAMK